MEQTFRKKSDASLLLTIKANVELGQSHEADGVLRHAVHFVAGGVLVEVDPEAALAMKGDRQILFRIPVIAAASLEILHDMRDGVYGWPVTWQNGQIAAPIDLMILEVRSKAWPGVGATRNAYYRVEVVGQPV
jgi:hypothetical protein